MASLIVTSILAASAAQATAVDCEDIWQTDDEGWYETNPTYTDPRDDSADWIISTPAAEGIDEATVDAGIAAVTNQSLKSVLLIRNGKLAFEKYYNNADRHTVHNIHSASKTLLRLLVGIAIDQGAIANLDVKVSDLVPEYFYGDNDTPSKKNITVRHLVTMSAGLDWLEEDTEYYIDDQPDWVQAIVDLDQPYSPGTTFEYSSGLTHLLSAVLQRTTGLSTCQFAHNELLDEMNITAEHWGRDPQEIYSGGYNVYMTARELAKIGKLMLQQGEWNGMQLVPSADITQLQTPSFPDGPTYKYGQLAYLRNAKGHPVYMAYGHGGQMVYVIPDLDLVYVSTQGTAAADGNEDGELEIDHINFVDNYLIPAIEQSIEQ